MSFESRSQTWLLLGLLLTLVVGVTHQADAGEVLGFKAWKAQQIEEAKLALERAQASQKAAPSSSSSAAGSVSSLGDGPHEKIGEKAAGTFTDPANASSMGMATSGSTLRKGPGAAATTNRMQKNGKEGDSRLQQVQLNFDIANELSVSDYFVLYINQLNTPNAIREAAEKMSPEEVAELMWAYKKQLESGRGSVGYIPGFAENPPEVFSGPQSLGAGGKSRPVGL